MSLTQEEFNFLFRNIGITDENNIDKIDAFKKFLAYCNIQNCPNIQMTIG